MASTPILMELKNVHRSFPSGKGRIEVLKGIDLKIAKGEIILILGKSGSGKTTLLNQIGGIDRPDRGQVLVNGRDITKFPDKELTRYRARTIGWIFQFFNLIPSLNALENVGLGLELAKRSERMEATAKQFLEKVGLGSKLNSFPSQLSGGEQQRVAIARALAKNPLIVVADEPTGNLDRKTGLEIVKLMKKLNLEDSTTFIIVSHDEELIQFANRVLHISDGQIIKEIVNN